MPCRRTRRRAPARIDATRRGRPGRDRHAGGAPASAAEEAGGGDGQAGITEAQVELAQDVFTRIRHEGVRAMDPVEELVWGLADAVARSTQAVLPTVPLKSHDEYTFVHSVNVSLAGPGPGARLRLRRPFAPRHRRGGPAPRRRQSCASRSTSSNKAGKLSGDEWTTMASHAELGAWELGALANSAPLSILVAFEHHLRYDGAPNYPAVRTTRAPTLASQLTAIADVYDAICTVRPYRRALSQAAALDVLRSRAGTFHDPYLVGQFCQLVTAVVAAQPDRGPRIFRDALPALPAGQPRAGEVLPRMRAAAHAGLPRLRRGAPETAKFCLECGAPWARWAPRPPRAGPRRAGVSDARRLLRRDTSPSGSSPRAARWRASASP